MMNKSADGDVQLNGDREKALEGREASRRGG